MSSMEIPSTTVVRIYNSLATIGLLPAELTSGSSNTTALYGLGFNEVRPRSSMPSVTNSTYGVLRGYNKLRASKKG